VCGPPEQDAAHGIPVKDRGGGGRKVRALSSLFDDIKIGEQRGR
jgi:hypothetical protein